jgi:hypothetical protein
LFTKAVKVDPNTVAVVAPLPSQLISRLPLGSGPGAFPFFGLPSGDGGHGCHLARLDAEKSRMIGSDLSTIGPLLHFTR